jgi:diguanylate cyclase (GGDEF)-like protein
VAWLSRRRNTGPAGVQPFTVAVGTVAAGILAVAIAWTMQPHVVQWASREAGARVIERVEQRLLRSLDAEAMESTDASARVDLAGRLEGLLARLREDPGAGIIQVHLYARDGTVLFSGQADRVGRKVLPSRVPRLAAALSGSVNTRLLALSTADDADLSDRYGEALAIYTPVIRDGRIVAAAEVYADLMPVRVARLVNWAVVVGAVTLALLLYVRAKQAEQEHRLEKLTREAFFDSLTGLANRALFRFRLQQAFHRSERRGELLAVMFLDLDRFKTINDTLGHAAGDQLLQAVGERLQQSVRPEDTVARLGGDEFTVLLESVPSVQDAIRVAERILANMRQPFVLAGQERAVLTSIGIAAMTPAHEQPDDLLQDADAALYSAKSAGRDRYVVFGRDAEPAVRRAS